jgi:chromosome segregation ATPase
MVGLGRGKGFAVGPSFSVLDDLTITGAIASRCRTILGLIEGRKIPSGSETSVLRAEVEMRKGEAMRERRSSEDLTVKLVEQEEQAVFWRKEASSLRREREEFAVQLAGFEDEAKKWRSTVAVLRAEVKRLGSELNSGDDDVDDEAEIQAVEEMQEILERINSSANSDFEYLSHAVDFLLEAG